MGGEVDVRERRGHRRGLLGAMRNRIEVRRLLDHQRHRQIGLCNPRRVGERKSPDVCFFLTSSATSVPCLQCHNSLL